MMARGGHRLEGAGAACKGEQPQHGPATRIVDPGPTHP